MIQSPVASAHTPYHADELLFLYMLDFLVEAVKT
jgi:hypothetical protein